MTARPRFEVVVAASAEERRLVSIDTVRLLTGIPEEGEGGISDALLGMKIDGVLSQCARSCRLKADGSKPLTLAKESVRATWTMTNRADYDQWSCWYADPGRTKLLLPWRAPITAIMISVDDQDLVQDTDFELLGSGVVQWLQPGSCWPFRTTVVDYDAGFGVLASDSAYQEGNPLPADVVDLIAQQVQYAASNPDLRLRSEDIPGVWSGSYNIPGGDAIDTSGLSLPLYDALSPFRGPPVFA